MRPCFQRVAARYLESRVVPFRRDREYAAYHAFLKRVRKLHQKTEALQSLLDSNDDLESALPPNRRLWWDADRFFRHFARDLGDRRDIGVGQGQSENYYQDQSYVRQNLDYALQEAETALQRTTFDQMVEALDSSDFRDEAEWLLDNGYVKASEIKALREGLEAGLQIRDEVATLRKRMKRVQDPSVGSGIPASAEMGDVEALYHASVDAKNLYRDGFSERMPAASSSAGLGGSQSLGSGKGSGISFTEDLYVAKEIARVFKEVAMIAGGKVRLSEVLEWISRSPQIKKIMEWYQENYMPCGRKCDLDPQNPTVFTRRVMNDEHLKDVKAGRVEYDPRKTWKNEVVPFDEAYPGREGLMGLYLSYLNFSGRYDPKFFGVGGPRGLVNRFKGVNPKDIGFIKATVNMAHPDVSYNKGEREVRVPPEAVLSVDKFIG